MAKYTEDFIARVKKAYPNSKTIHMHAEQHHGILGRYLDDSCSSSLPIDWLLKQNDIIVVHLKCEEAREKLNLYTEWINKYSRS